jgi:hypothetical protein
MKLSVGWRDLIEGKMEGLAEKEVDDVEDSEDDGADSVAVEAQEDQDAVDELPSWRCRFGAGKVKGELCSTVLRSRMVEEGREGDGKKEEAEEGVAMARMGPEVSDRTVVPLI